MPKITNKRKLKGYLQHYDTQEITNKYAAKQLEVSQRRFQQVYKQYQLTGKTPDIRQHIGRPKQEISQEWQNIIKQQYKETWCNAVYLEKKNKHQTSHPYS